MIKIKVNGKKHELEQGWEDLTFRKFIALLSAKTDPEILSIFLGLPQEELKGAKFQNLDAVLSTIAFTKKEPAIEPQPEKVGQYIFPKDVTFETIEQYEAVRVEINRVAQTADIKEQTEALAFYAAVYIQGMNEPFDNEKARYMAQMLYDLPCLEVLAAGSFLQAKCLSIQSGKSMSYLRQNTLLKKKMPALNRSMRRLGFMLHLTR